MRQTDGVVEPLRGSRGHCVSCIKSSSMVKRQITQVRPPLQIGRLNCFSPPKAITDEDSSSKCLPIVTKHTFSSIYRSVTISTDNSLKPVLKPFYSFRLVYTMRGANSSLTPSSFCNSFTWSGPAKYISIVLILKGFMLTYMQQ